MRVFVGACLAGTPLWCDSMHPFESRNFVHNFVESACLAPVVALPYTAVVVNAQYILNGGTFVRALTDDYNTTLETFTTSLQRTTTT